MSGVAQFDPARGLRDLGNGANDTSGQYGIVLNAMPDPVLIRDAKTNIDPLYPKMDHNDEKYQLSYKGFLAFRDTRWNHQSTSEFRTDVDIVYYLDNFAGQYSKNENLLTLVEHLSYVGIVDNDVLPNENSSKDNTTTWSGKKTMRHTGGQRLYAGQLVMWDLAPLDPNVKGGVDNMTDVVANAKPAWVIPYDPIIHKGSPQLLLAAMRAAGDPNGSPTAPLLKTYAREWLGAVKKCAIVLAAAAGLNWNAVNNLTEAQVTGLLLDPTFNLVAPGQYPPLTVLPQKPFDSVESVGGTIFRANTDVFADELKKKQSAGSAAAPKRGFEPTPQRMNDEQKLNLMQLTAAEDLFYYNCKVNGFYTDRIFGEAITSCDSGKDFDVVPIRILNSS